MLYLLEHFYFNLDRVSIFLVAIVHIRFRGIVYFEQFVKNVYLQGMFMRSIFLEVIILTITYSSGVFQVVFP